MKVLNVAYVLILLLLGCMQDSAKNGVNDNNSRLTEIISYQIKNIFQDTINLRMAAKLAPFNTMQGSYDLTMNIDTVFVSPKKDRALCITVVGYQFISQEDNRDVPEKFYDSYGFLGIKKADSSWEIKWADLSSRVKFKSDVKASKTLQDFYFQRLNKIGDQGNNSLYIYNLGDERFWNSPLWNRYF